MTTDPNTPIPGLAPSGPVHRMRVHIPERGYYAATLDVMSTFPEVAVGARGEIAVRVADRHAILFGFGEHRHGDSHYDGTQSVWIELHKAPPSVQPSFVPHPGVSDDIKQLVPTSDQVRVGLPKIVTASRAHQVWRMSLTDGQAGEIGTLYATVTSHSSIVDCVAAMSPRHGLERCDANIDLTFGERVVSIARGDIVEPVGIGRTVRITGALPMAGMRFFRWRLACAVPQDHPLADRTADEHESASLGPWYGHQSLDEPFLGVDHVNVDIQFEQEMRIAFADPRRGPAFVPRPNPNNGGTDSAFGCVFWPPDHALSARALQWTAEAWGLHPMVYSEPYSHSPLRSDHQGLTTEKLQPKRGRIEGEVVCIGTSPEGRWPMDGQHRAWVTVYTAFSRTKCPALRLLIEHWLASEVYDHATILGWPQNGREEGRIRNHVEAAIDLGLGDRAELNEYLDVRKVLVDEVTAKRVQGEIVPVHTSERGVPWGDMCSTEGTAQIVDEHTLRITTTRPFRHPPRVGYQMRASFADRSWVRFDLEEMTLGKAVGDVITLRAVEPTFDRDTDGQHVTVHSVEQGWTPWEEAQYAWGCYRTWTRTTDAVVRRHAYQAARNVALVLQEIDGSYAIPWRVRYLADGSVPDCGQGSLDIDGLNWGPGGTFSWASVALRVYLLLQEQVADPDDVSRRAARALTWMDQHQRPHLVDAHMSLRGSFAAVIERHLVVPEPKATEKRGSA